MGDLQRLAKQTAVFGLSSLLGRVLTWALTPIFLHVYPLAAFGALTDLYALAFYALIALSFGMETTYFRWAGHKLAEPTAYAQASWLVALLVLGVGGLGLALHAPLAAALGYGAQPQWLLLLLASVVVDVLAALPMARLRQQERAGRFVAIAWVHLGLSFGGTLGLLAWWGPTLSAPLAANAGAGAVRLVLALASAGVVRQRPQWATLAQLAGYGNWLMAAGLVGAINLAMGQNLLPRLWEGGAFAGRWVDGLAMNGLYAAVYKLATLLQLANQAFRYAADPYYFRQAEDADGKRRIARVLGPYTLISLWAALGVTLLGPVLVALPLGPGGSSLYPASSWAGFGALPVLALAFAAQGVFLNLSVWYKLADRPRMGLWIGAFGLGLNLAVNVLAIPTLGLYGTALASLVSYATMAVLAYALGQTLFPLPYRLWAISGPALVAVVGVLVVPVLPYTGWWGPGLRLLLALGATFWLGRHLGLNATEIAKRLAGRLQRARGAR